ncbi:MAG TPA: UpxY family transcription antiterminator [Hanamia sp.]
MQKNWYIVYTKAKCEKKVAALLAKKKIKNFCPVHCRQINQFSRMKLVYEPLFSSYVFVYMQESKINVLKQLSNVVNLVYWKGQPAIIQNEEIEEIREFVAEHENIRLERSGVNVNSLASVVDRPSYAMDGNVVMIKNKFIKVNLPSLGYMMVAEMEGDGVMGREIGLKEKEALLYS